VITASPMFTAADAVGAPALKEGLWLVSDADCRVDIRKPVQKWPRCANWYLVRGNEMLGLNAGDRRRPTEWTVIPYVLAAGDPRIMQIDFTSPEAEGDDPSPLFVYMAVVPKAWDEAGRITASQSWSIACGPPPLNAKGKPDPLAVTDKPFPGMTLGKTPDGKNASCWPRDAAALRGAATASRAEEALATARWVRDTLP
jgi:hypothetical protein